MAVSGIVRLEPNGPVGLGLTKIQLNPADFQSDLPEQHWHICFEDEAVGLTVGVWTTTSMQEAFGPYPGDEFMCILEGQVALVDGGGSETVVQRGETFIVRNGIPVSWKQVGFCRKFFMTYLRPDAPAATIDTVEGGINILKKLELGSKLQVLETSHPFEIDGDMPIQEGAICFSNDQGNMTAGLWLSEPFESVMSPFPCHEFVQMLEGEVAISEANGRTHEFCAGEVFFIPAGVQCSWKAADPVADVLLHCCRTPATLNWDWMLQGILAPVVKTQL